MLCVLCLLSREAQGAEEVMNFGAASLSSRHSSTLEPWLYNQSDAETEEGQLIVKEISEPTVVHLEVRLVSYQNLRVENKP